MASNLKKRKQEEIEESDNSENHNITKTSIHVNPNRIRNLNQHSISKSLKTDGQEKRGHSLDDFIIL
jgi:hypothetical protein